MCCIRAMFFATHVNIATLAQNEQGQTGKYRKSHSNFPHTSFFQKKGLLSRARESPRPEGRGRVDSTSV